jgi:shikimate kinase
MRIYLIGYMASGKSNLGQLLAIRLGYEFVDLDYLFEERFRITVLDFFEKYDENGFRRIEQSLLHESAGWENTVISTGGGTPCFFNNMEVIRRSGISVYLRWEIEPLMVRLHQAKRKRPLLKNIPVEDMDSHVREQLQERETYYMQADIIANGQDPDIDRLVTTLQGLSHP